MTIEHAEALVTPATPSLWSHVLKAIGRSGLPKAEGLVYRLGGMTLKSDAEFEVDFFGLSYHGNLSQHIDKHIWYFGAYTKCELLFLEILARTIRAKKNSAVLMDIGANVGQHSLYMSQFVDEIIAFEPAPQAIRQFKRNIIANSINNITLHEVALGDHDSIGSLGTGFEGNSGSRSLVWSFAQDKNEDVIVKHGDTFVKNTGCQHIDILKLDVEGFEKNVFVGLNKKLSLDRPIILFEMVGAELVGGFRNLGDLKSCLYTDHTLFALVGKNKPRLRDYAWGDEAVVLVPNESLKLVAQFIW